MRVYGYMLRPQSVHVLLLVFLSALQSSSSARRLILRKHALHCVDCTAVCAAGAPSLGCGGGCDGACVACKEHSGQYG